MRRVTSAAATPPNMSAMPVLAASAAPCASFIIGSMAAQARARSGSMLVHGAGRDEVLQGALVDEARVEAPREVRRGPGTAVAARLDERLDGAAGRRP